MVHYNTDSTGTVINQSLCFRTKGEDCIQGVSFRRYPDSRWRKTAAWGSGNVYPYEELKVEDEAAAYDYYDTNKYWNLHTSGRFVKEVAKTHVIEMAVHDEIFYRQAMAEKLTLDEKEEEQLRSRQEDFWTDMTEEQQERLGVDKAEIDCQLEKSALAQKYQNQIAAENNSDFDGYSAGAEPYEQILKEHKYKLNEKLWDRVDFGNIILNH